MCFWATLCACVVWALMISSVSPVLDHSIHVRLTTQQPRTFALIPCHLQHDITPVGPSRTHSTRVPGRGALWVALIPQQTLSSNTNVVAEHKLHQFTSPQLIPVVDDSARATTAQLPMNVDGNCTGVAIKMRTDATVLKCIGRRWIKVVVGISLVCRTPTLL